MDISDRYKGKKKWIRFLAELLDRYFQDEIGKSAAALTYYMIFTFFPFLIFLSMLLGFMNIPLLPLEGEVANFLPQDMIMLINLFITHITESRNGGLLFVGFLLTFWFSTRAVRAMMGMINYAYRGDKPASWFLHMLSTAIFTVCMMLFIVLSLGALVIGEGALQWVSQFFPISVDMIVLWSRLRFLVLMVILFFILSALYYVAPSYKMKWEDVVWGVLAALLSWTIFSVGFAYYVDNMGRYSMIYGSIGAVIVFLMWLYFSCVAVLMGAEFNHVRMMIYRKGRNGGK
ncbi:MAG: YihY/virulence factor BrkB family protein [Epulopiscium sp.]|jgi:membrane protein|nr:YihY/virulence factor BrkB family protein [Candidatus Epulonipiscium sp.]